MNAEVLDLAQRIATRLGAVDGVAAVALGGSWARGTAHPESDIDLGIYYHPHHRPSVQALQDLAHELDDRHPPDAVTEFGAWGPWVDGGAWLQIEGRHVDWLYRDLAHVSSVIDECHAGITACHYTPGHPHGFHSHAYMGEVHYAVPLHDPDGALAKLHARTTPYPPALKRAIHTKYLWEAGFALDTGRKSAARGDVFHAAGSLFRSAACLVQVIYAVNDCYVINEKGAVNAADALPLRPPAFSAVLHDVLSHPGSDPAALGRGIDRLSELIEETRVLGTEPGIGREP